jgi:hypothetical protein
LAKYRKVPLIVADLPRFQPVRYDSAHKEPKINRQAIGLSVRLKKLVLAPNYCLLP